MRATSLVLIGVSQIHVVLNILINRNYIYCNTMYKWINKRFCLSVCLSIWNFLFGMAILLNLVNLKLYYKVPVCIFLFVYFVCLYTV